MARKKSSKKLVRVSNRAPVRKRLPAGYASLLNELKTRVRAAQLKALLSVNREMIQLYWDIGRMIVEQQRREGWGGAVIESLAEDIHKAFPDLQGFSRTNLFRARAFFLAYTKDPKVPQAVGQLTKAKVPQLVGLLDGQHPPQAATEIPWGHNVILIEKIKYAHERIWYAQQVIEHGWSRNVLVLHVESDLFGRKGRAITNFATTLPPLQSDLAQQTFKDPYLFDFLSLTEDAHERELENGLLDHIQKFLVELGVGFAFVGRQVSLAIDGDDYSIDLLFYHLRLRCFVVIDLKTGDFTPEYAGKMNFYLSAVDDAMRHADDAPSIGLILCKARKRVVAEYALRDISKPIGVAEWQTRLVKSLPKHLKSSLPTIAQLEAELGDN